MPDLGKYAFEVGLAYGVSFALVAALVIYVWTRSSRIRAALKEVEDRRERSSK